MLEALCSTDTQLECAGLQADAGPENIAAQARVGGKDEDMRAMMRALSTEKRNMILHRQGVKQADWDAKEIRIKPDVWESLRTKSAQPPCSNPSS